MKKFRVDYEVNQINLFSERWYQINDGESEHILPSVTTYLEAYPKGWGYEQWLINNKDPYALRDEAAQIGSHVHSLIERTLKGEEIEFVEDATPIDVWEKYLCWCRFWKDFNENPASVLFTKEEIKKNSIEIKEIVTREELTEFITYDLEEQYAGTVDKIIKIVYPTYSEYAVVDWKTGGSIYQTAYLQTSAYAKSTAKMIKRPVERTIIIQLGMQLNAKGYRIYSHTGQEIDNDFLDFQHTKAVWLREHGNEKPRFKVYPTKVSLDFIKNNQIIKEK